MSVTDDLAKLADLHQRGVLSDDEFARAKARVLGDTAAQAKAPPIAAINGLRRSRTDRWLGGVCGGLARISGLDAWIWRLIFVLAVMCAGTGFVAYVLLWLFVPEDNGVVDAATPTYRAG